MNPLATLTRRQLVCGAAAALLGAAFGPCRSQPVGATSAMPPLLLATELPPGADPAHDLVSEKYDGVRALWDGTRLRFRSGRVVAAPPWFLARLPAQALDGELWLGRGRFEALSGLVRRQMPDDAAWRALRYMVFELPGAPGTFAERAERITGVVGDAAWPALVAVEQRRVADRAALQVQLAEVLRQGGEGLMLHRADAPYQTGRSEVLRKLKPLDDAEAQVVGHLAGLGKYAGRLGALRVRGADGATFHIGTGFSDAERAAPPPLGAWVTYTHRGVTRTGVPRFASFLRLHVAP